MIVFYLWKSKRNYIFTVSSCYHSVGCMLIIGILWAFGSAAQMLWSSSDLRLQIWVLRSSSRFSLSIFGPEFNRFLRMQKACVEKYRNIQSILVAVFVFLKSAGPNRSPAAKLLTINETGRSVGEGRLWDSEEDFTLNINWKLELLGVNGRQVELFWCIIQKWW